jgi:hypothetical protein
VNSLPKAYNELVGLLLTEDDRAKFEWAIGSALVEGPRAVVLIHGATASGKSTLLNIVRKLVMIPLNGGYAPRVIIKHEVVERELERDIRLEPQTFIFAATNQPVYIPEGVHVITTTGDRVSVNKHHVLMDQINDEAIVIAQHCIDVYNNGPRAVYNQENNR